MSDEGVELIGIAVMRVVGTESGAGVAEESVSAVGTGIEVIVVVYCTKTVS